MSVASVATVERRKHYQRLDIIGGVAAYAVYAALLIKWVPARVQDLMM